MKWFKHDTDASHDAKVKKLLLRHGAEGYAVYFHCIELIAGSIDNDNITFELEHDAEIIADNLKIKGESDFSAVDKVNNIMRAIIQLGLFQESNNRIYCLSLAKRIDQSMTSNPKMRDIIKKIKSHDSVMISHDSVMQDKIRLDKIRLDKNREEKSPPTLKEIQDYIVSKNYNVDAKQFYDYFTTGNWVDSKGNKVKNWKQKIITWNNHSNKKEEKSQYEFITKGILDD